MTFPSPTGSLASRQHQETQGLWDPVRSRKDSQIAPASCHDLHGFNRQSALPFESSPTGFMTGQEPGYPQGGAALRAGLRDSGEPSLSIPCCTERRYRGVVDDELLLTRLRTSSKACRCEASCHVETTLLLDPRFCPSEQGSSQADQVSGRLAEPIAWTRRHPNPLGSPDVPGANRSKVVLQPSPTTS